MHVASNWINPKLLSLILSERNNCLQTLTILAGNGTAELSRDRKLGSPGLRSTFSGLNHFFVLSSKLHPASASASIARRPRSQPPRISVLQSRRISSLIMQHRAILERPHLPRVRET